MPQPSAVAKASAKVARRAMSTSAIVAVMPRAASEVTPWLGDAAGDDAAVMVEVGIDVQRDAVIADPAPHPDADRGDLVLAAAVPATQTPTRPSRRSPVTPKRARVRIIHSSSRCTWQRTSRAAALQVEHDIGDPLAGAVIGVLAAAAAAEHREPVRVEQIVGPCAGAGGVERRVFEQPDQFAGAARRGSPRRAFHRGDRRLRRAPRRRRSAIRSAGSCLLGSIALDMVIADLLSTRPHSCRAVVAELVDAQR